MSKYTSEIDTANTLITSHGSSWNAINAESVARMKLQNQFKTGLDINDICSSRFTDKERNEWGENLFRIFLEQLYKFEFLHTDPNIANFAFEPGGKIIIYDFGNCKKIPKKIT